MSVGTTTILLTRLHIGTQISLTLLASPGWRSNPLHTLCQPYWSQMSEVVVFSKSPMTSTTLNVRTFYLPRPQLSSPPITPIISSLRMTNNRPPLRRGYLHLRTHAQKSVTNTVVPHPLSTLMDMIHPRPPQWLWYMGDSRWLLDSSRRLKRLQVTVHSLYVLLPKNCNGLRTTMSVISFRQTLFHPKLNRLENDVLITNVIGILKYDCVRASM